MKKKITAIILAVVMLLSTVGTFASSAAVLTDERTAKEISMLDQMEKKLDNGKMELYVNEETAMVAIKNKATGEIMLSNPYDAKENAFLAQLLVEYKKGNNTSPPLNMNSYTNCISFGNPTLVFEYTEDSVKVTYKLAETELFKFLPEVLTEETYDRVVAAMESNETVQAYIAQGYESISRVMTYNKKKATADSPAYYQMRGSVHSERKATANLYFEAIGFTADDIAAEYEKLGYTSTTSDGVAEFTIPLEYKLTDKGFTAEVDASNISFDRSTYILCSVTILPYFNAATQYEAGYDFIPDGSGALVRYEDVTSKGSTSSIDVSLYGNDNSYYEMSTKIEEQATMPVFGQVLNELPYKSGFFAIIENSEAVASITSKHDTYHSVSAKFSLAPIDKTTITSTGDITDIGLKTDTVFTEKCTVNYYMLTDKALQDDLSISGFETSYVGMAKLYRDVLTANGTIEKMTDAEANKGAKLFLEVFGSMKVEKRYATIPLTVNDSLTTFDQVMLIQDELHNAGIGPMNFILTGFANEGLSAKYPTKIKWLGSVGGKSGFEKLLKDAKDKGYEVSPNFDFVTSTYLYGNDNIKYKKHGARRLDERYTVKFLYDPAFQSNAIIGGIVISSGSYEYAYEKFAKSAKKYDMDNLSVSTLGTELNSDFNKKDFIYRTESMENAANLLAKLSGKVQSSTAYKLLVETGNSYTYDYVSYITKASLDSSRRRVESEAVPFTGMVLHGSIVFTGNALNMEGDADYTFLKTLENGANLYFTIAYENVEYLKLNWNFNEYYSVSYDLWKDYIIAKYAEYSSVMGSKQNSYIEDHQFLNTSEADGTFTVCRHDNKGAIENSTVVRVEYANGEGFFLNYNSEFAVEITYGGSRYVVEPLSYKPYTNNN